MNPILEIRNIAIVAVLLAIVLGMTVGSALQIGDAAGGDLTGTYPDPSIANAAVDEVHLNAVDAAVDEECLTYESGAGGDFEWQTCGAGGGISDGYDTIGGDSGTSTASGADTISLLGDTDGIDVVCTNGSPDDCTFTFDASELPNDDIAEAVISFATACGSGSKLYVSGTNLACNADNAGVTAVTGSVPITSTGGATPDIECPTCVVSVTSTSPIVVTGTTTPTISLNTLYKEGGVVFTYVGNVETTTDWIGRIYNPFAATSTIQYVDISLSTAASSSTVTVDIHLDGTTIFSTQGNRPSIADGGNYDRSGTPDTTTWGLSGYLTMDIDLEDSGDEAVDLQVIVVFRMPVFDSP